MPNHQLVHCTTVLDASARPEIADGSLGSDCTGIEVWFGSALNLHRASTGSL